MHVYIVAIIISVTLMAILFFALRSTVKRIDYNTKKYFIDKLQDYDYLIDEKQKILDELNEKIEENKRILKEEKENIKQNVESEQIEYHVDTRMPKYKDENLFKNYKEIKNKFSFDKEKLIKTFVNDIQKDGDNNYKTLVGIRNKFDNKKIYKIINLRSDEQIKYIHNILTNTEINVIKEFMNVKKFKITEFIVRLDTLIEKNDPTIYVYTGQKEENYNYISPFIKTIYDNNINEGVKINYKGILYDYSL